MSEMSPAKAARLAEAEKERKARQKYKITVITVCVCVLVLVLFVAVFSSNLFYNVTTAVEIGGYKFTVADFNFNYVNSYNSYYNNIYNLYGSYSSILSSMLPDTSVSLWEQAYPGASDGVSTWGDYFKNSALDRMRSVAMLCTEAEKAGFTLSDEDMASIDAAVTSAKASAESGGFPNVNSYLARVYGKGMTEKVYRKTLERDSLAAAYSESVEASPTYTQEQKDSYYAEHKDDYDVIVYRTYFISGSAVTDDEETEVDETLSAEDAMAQAEATAKDILSKATSEQGYIDAVAALHADDEDYDADEATKMESRGANLGTAIKDWLLSADRKAGDVDMLKTPDDSTSQGYYVLYYLSRDDNQYHAVSGYYGLVANVSEGVSRDDYKTDEEYDEAVKALTELNGNTVLGTYTNGSDKTLEGFQKAMTDVGDFLSESGAITNSGIYDLPDSLSAWLHDPARVPGDTTTVYDPDFGCFVVYFTSDDGVYADLLSESSMRNEDYEKWYDEAIEPYTVNTRWEMRFAGKIPSLGD